MNYWVLALTFLSVNLDFFFMLIFLLRKFPVTKVLLGYWLGIVVLMSASYFIGRSLAAFLPEWLLGILGVLPIYLALRRDNDRDDVQQHRSAVWSVFLTYLSVCAGCNLAIFLPVLAGETLTNFGLALLFISGLTVLIVFLIKLIAHIPLVNRMMTTHGERLMRICYLAIGLYVFWDSGLIHHLISLWP
ncbi:cadmium resistance transporter [Lapidilactobacillus wuchangensis]|uniref:cadmium resistance transporter n=1 Tax=Lapidilactobacillus wuchangensis TaxID=2486001 RepID=UPI000F79F242|nr:cadmium resistance transporter [Lapidilactobacillus wuchangensis]